MCSVDCPTGVRADDVCYGSPYSKQLHEGGVAGQVCMTSCIYANGNRKVLARRARVCDAVDLLTVAKSWPL